MLFRTLISLLSLCHMMELVSTRGKEREGGWDERDSGWKELNGEVE